VVYKLSNGGHPSQGIRINVEGATDVAYVRRKLSHERKAIELDGCELIPALCEGVDECELLIPALREGVDEFGTSIEDSTRSKS